MAFPTTGLLDDFNRAAENPLGNGTWLGPLTSGLVQMSVGSGGSANRAIPASAAQGNSYWSAATFGPDMEVYGEAPAIGGAGEFIDLYLRQVDMGLSTRDGYRLAVVFSSSWSLRRVDNNADTVIATATQLFSTGDSLGFEVIGSALKGYLKTAGVWSLIISATDATYNSASTIGFGSKSQNSHWDNFSGGTVVAAAAAARPGHGMLLSGYRNQVIQRV